MAGVTARAILRRGAGPLAAGRRNACLPLVAISSAPAGHARAGARVQIGATLKHARRARR